jgi:23S rRNA (guanosine2251-2'-O)-methyltransferase
MRKLKNEELGRLSPDDFRREPKYPVSLLLDNVRSMYNVGSVFRTADAFRVEKIWLCGITPQPPHREIHKTALGATDTVAWEAASDPVTLAEHLKNAGCYLVSIEQCDRSVPLQHWQPPAGSPIVLLFGNEVEGVRQELVSRSDAVVEIPQYGTKHSFNISVSAGIVLWELFRKMNWHA